MTPCQALTFTGLEIFSLWLYRGSDFETRGQSTDKHCYFLLLLFIYFALFFIAFEIGLHKFAVLPSWRSPLLSFNAAFDDDLASITLLSAFCGRCKLDTSICPPAVQVFYFPLSISPSSLAVSSSFLVLFNHKPSILVEHTQIHRAFVDLITHH